MTSALGSKVARLNCPPVEHEMAARDGNPTDATGVTAAGSCRQYTQPAPGAHDTGGGAAPAAVEPISAAEIIAASAATVRSAHIREVVMTHCLRHHREKCHPDTPGHPRTGRKPQPRRPGVPPLLIYQPGSNELTVLRPHEFCSDPIAYADPPESTDTCGPRYSC